MTLPPLGLNVEVSDANGVRTRWGAGEKTGDVPQNLSFRTKRGDGFADSSVSLSRRIDRDYPDINLYDDLTIIGEDGSIAYEGRVASNPRSLGEAHAMTVTTAGWMTHARDRKFSEVYVDRDLGGWQGPSLSRRADIASGGSNPDAASTTVDRDDSGTPALSSTAPGLLNFPLAELLYDAGPTARIARIYVGNMTLVNVVGSDTLLSVTVSTWSSDTAATLAGSGEQRANTVIDQSLAAQRFAAMGWSYASATGGVAGTNYGVRWGNVAVYGDHGLPITGAMPGGVYASDVIGHIAASWCPRLNTNGVQTTTFPIPHLVFRDRVDPYDAFLEVNKFHRWELAVWENKTLHYAPLDLTEYDWQIDLADPRVTVDLQGDSTEHLANGIAVTFTDVSTGAARTLTPDDSPDLSDSNIENPANRHGLPVWTEIALTSPTTADAAIQIGRAALAEFNQPSGAGTITVQGHIKDRAGNWQQAWKVRAGDRVAITSSTSLSDRPRVIGETDYTHDTATLRMSVDCLMPRVDAVLDRLSTALTAANLT